ncbi:MAG: hypothetical protein JWN79_2110 [Gemmatimonadetes bacterium]|jgi:uncharacterized protein (TIGR02246 family)|nr:hypothetical protein [Gemmatimonadota bacterium]
MMQMPTRPLYAILAALLLATACHATVSRARDEPAAAAEIRALRARSNAAIAAHDARGVAAMMVDDIVITGGNGGPLMQGRERSEASFARQFADTTFLGYVRTPLRVEIGSAAPVAAESGEWAGRWRAADGTRELHGTYLAMWRRDDGAWRLRSELYVTLACSGSATCPHTP